jgi:protein-L-isoaspartate O-methyltransferase
VTIASPDYVWPELGLFAEAKRWKAYWASEVAPFLGQTVLEVGAGLGANTAVLCGSRHTRWVCLEPDESMARALLAKEGAGQLPPVCSMVRGTVETLPGDDLFDGILYADVLEYTDDDRAELARAALHLGPGAT